MIIVLAGVLALPAATAAAATCPTVDPSTGAVSPAPAPDADWSGCDLHGANLTGADLTGANLSGANLYLAIITSANFTDATLTGLQSGDITYQSQSPPTLPANWTWIVGGYLAGPGADLAGASLQSAFDLNGIDLAGADLAGVNLNDANISNADFASANLDNATITGVIMSGDTLTSATLTGADLTGSLLENSSLAGADLSASTAGAGVVTTFSGDDLTNANLTSAELFGSKLTGDNLTSATLTNADLDTAKLTGDNLAAAALAGANLSQVTSSGLTGTPASLPTDWSDSSGFLLGPTAYLARVDMTGADLANADLSNATRTSATLTGATLTDANLSDAELSDVTSGSLIGTPASLPANWSVGGGYLLGPTAYLYQANLSGVNLGNADLEQANLQDANLANVNLGTADLSAANLDGVTSGGVVRNQGVLPSSWSVDNGFLIGPGANLDGENLAGFNFTGEYLNSVLLVGADLENADFSSGSLADSVLSNADLTNANLANASLTSADISGANFKGVSLTGIVSGQISGTPLNLPGPWQLLDGYLVGPGASLVGAELGGVTFDDADLYAADLYQADLSGTTWSNTTCPDGTNSDNDGGTCANNLNTPPVPSPAITGRPGAQGWYISPVTVTWNWTDAVGQVNPAKCTTSTNSAGEGVSVKLSASCTSVQGVVGTAVRFLRIDTTAPRVRVTGVTNGKVYPLGDVPAAGCATTDSVSGVATAAKVTVTGTSSHGTGSFAATCAGAVNRAGITAAPVTVRYSIGYRFGGFAAPKPGATLPESARTITVRFRLANAAGHAIPASWATALGKAGQVRVAFTGPGVARVTAACSWNARSGYFQCSVRLPSGIKTGKQAAYAITAQERLGTAFVPVPAPGKTANPETIHFG